MYLLLLCSLSVAAIAIDRFLFYRRAAAGGKELLNLRRYRVLITYVLDFCTRVTARAARSQIGRAHV